MIFVIRHESLKYNTDLLTQDLIRFLEFPVISSHLELLFTTLQAEISRVRFPMMSFKFFINIILPAFGST